MRRRAACAAFAATLVLAGGPAARAAILHVPSDYPTVGAALAVATSGDIVRIAPGRYPEYGLTVPGGVTLLGEGPTAEETWFDGAYAGLPILTVPAGASRVTLRGLHFRYGSSTGGGAIRMSGGTARHVIEDCVFEYNRGSAVAADLATIRGCTFRRNEGTVGGAVRGQDLLVSDCEFRENTSSSEGGALRIGAGEVTRCRFEANATSWRGGAVRNEAAFLDQCVLVRNSATGGTAQGGAVSATAAQTIRDCVFLENRSGGDGGALWMTVTSGAEYLVEGCRFLDNTAKRGGGIHGELTTVRVERSSFLGNGADAGGAIFAPTNPARTLTVRQTVIQGGSSGGAIASAAGTLPPAMEACDIFANAGGDWTGPLAGLGFVAGNFSADALFCDAPRESLAVSTASPLLAENNDSGLPIGAGGAMCAPEGVVVTSIPPGLVIDVDGTGVVVPVDFPWTPGSAHEVSAPLLVEPQSGVGLVFREWSDGGAPAHTVIAPSPPATLRASFDATFLLAMSADSGGVIEPAGGWLTPYVPVVIRAQPQLDHVFLGWQGTGVGSYTGPDLEAVIPMTGPVTQHARFEYRGTRFLTMDVLGNGTVSPPSGPQTAGTVVTIQATPDLGWVFASWVGTGDGSYSGQNATAQVTMNADIRQLAHFANVGTRQLTMVARPGGTVSPESGPHTRGAVVSITATPDPGWLFHRWAGTGNGSYTGTERIAQVTLHEDLVQEAHFRPRGFAPVEMRVVGDGTVSPASGDYTLLEPLPISATPGPGSTFDRWVGEGEGSYTGPIAGISILVLGPIVQTAYFAPGGVYPLTMTAAPGGLVYPLSGNRAAGEVIQITATPAAGYRFVEWQGDGMDSYSGTDAMATIAMHGAVTQHAVFELDPAGHGYEFSISASDTDPFRNTAAPTGGVRQLHLWLTCSQLGLAAFECGVTGTLPVLGFAPAPGVFNVGTATDLQIAVDECPTGEDVRRRLGTWTVWDTGGALCVTESRTNDVFGAVDCGSIPSLWWRPIVRGFSSSGAPPCLAGANGCGDTGTPVPLPVALPEATGFTAVAPNPFRGTTELRFALAAPGRARLAVYDVAGRLIRVLRDGTLPAGNHAAAWDGRGSGGPVAGGIYFVRLEAAGRSETARVVRLGPSR